MIAMLSRRQILFAASFLFAQALSAATIISGGNLANQTWTAAGSPYIVMGDATIVAGATLNLEPGVEVRFASADSQGAGRDALRVELTINGTLNASGTAASPVIFKGQTASAGSWYGIILAGASLSTIHYAFIHHAVTGVTCEGGSGLQGNNLTASTNQTAFSVNHAVVTFNELVAFANQTAIIFSGDGSLAAYRSVIYGNALQAFQINPSVASLVVIDHCTMHRNGTYGVYIGPLNKATINIRNTIITGNDYGVYRSDSPNGSATVTYSDVWGNATNFVNVVPGTRMISQDPLYIDADGADNIFATADDNLRLQPNTPCAYRSSTATDIGAYENQKLLISRPEFIGEDVRFSVFAISNSVHHLEFTEDFATWTSVASKSNGPIGGGRLYLTNFAVRTLPKRFYRIRLN